jgi:hypothetical protein
MKNRKLIIAIIGITVSLCAWCIVISVVYDATPMGRSAATSRAETQTAMPSRTIAPTRTTRPTNTPGPTAQPRLTNTPRPTNTSTPTRTATPTRTNTPTPTETPTLSAAFELIRGTETVNAGGRATFTIRTLPGVGCSIAYTTPSGLQSSAEGLGNKSAGANGLCSWTWTIGTSTRAGNGRMTITANGLTLLSAN